MSDTKLSDQDIFKLITAVKLAEACPRTAIDFIDSEVKFDESLKRIQERFEKVDASFRDIICSAIKGDDKKNDLAPLKEKSVQWWLKRSLSQEDYQKALENIKNQKKEHRLTSIVDVAWQALATSFNWETSTEGTKYWGDLYDQLIKESK